MKHLRKSCEIIQQPTLPLFSVPCPLPEIEDKLWTRHLILLAMAERKKEFDPKVHLEDLEDWQLHLIPFF